VRKGSQTPSYRCTFIVRGDDDGYHDNRGESGENPVELPVVKANETEQLRDFLNILTSVVKNGFIHKRFYLSTVLQSSPDRFIR
jgi:hypothetical protein